MKSRLEQIGLGLIALAVANLIWLPCVQETCDGAPDLSGVSPMALALALLIAAGLLKLFALTRQRREASKQNS